MKKNKLTFGILLALSICVIQCAGPWITDNVGEHSSSKLLIGDWKTIDASWTFKDDGKITIDHQNGVKQNGSWTIEQDDQIKIIFNEERIVLYSIEIATDTKLKLSNDLQTIILTK